jgi:hypothetical protein
MCNLYSITTNLAAIIALNRYAGNLPPMPGVLVTVVVTVGAGTPGIQALCAAAVASIIVAFTTTTVTAAPAPTTRLRSGRVDVGDPHASAAEQVAHARRARRPRRRVAALAARLRGRSNTLMPVIVTTGPPVIPLPGAAPPW